MPYGSLLTDTVQSSTSGTPPQFNDGSGTQVGTLCRAWVNFNGTSSGTITPRASFNVTSVTKNGTGNYTITFTNALPDANYCQIVCGGNTANTEILSMVGNISANPAYTTTSTRAYFDNASGTNVDPTYANVAIFR
jgi:hypothetical protein